MSWDAVQYFVVGSRRICLSTGGTLAYPNVNVVVD